ncbi:MAG: hypothetical protein Q7S03_00835 [bacterium]|nr:hypothetical protein [bacterium]
MNLEPLQNTGEVSEREFRQLFEHRLGMDFPRALIAFNILGSMHSFSIANVIHLGLQKGNAIEIIDGLEKWCEIFPKALDPIMAHVDTRMFFDVLYGSFMTSEDTAAGLGPFDTLVEPDGLTLKVVKPGRRIWTPSSP